MEQGWLESTDLRLANDDAELLSAGGANVFLDPVELVIEELDLRAASRTESLDFRDDSSFFQRRKKREGSENEKGRWQKEVNEGDWNEDQSREEENRPFFRSSLEASGGIEIEDFGSTGSRKSGDVGECCFENLRHGDFNTRLVVRVPAQDQGQGWRRFPL